VGTVIADGITIEVTILALKDKALTGIQGRRYKMEIKAICTNPDGEICPHLCHYKQKSCPYLVVGKSDAVIKTITVGSDAPRGEPLRPAGGASDNDAKQ
jgi:hypothetical protein